MGFCKHGNGHLGSITGREFRDKSMLGAPCNKLIYLSIFKFLSKHPVVVSIQISILLLSVR
jgi:hypothetical protein